MYANREGLFHAYPVNCGVADSGPNNLATVTILFRLFEELIQGEWTDCSSEAMEITGYFYLEKKDGQVNTVAVDALRAALGWNSDDPAWLQQTDLSGVPVQVKLANEEYNGKTKLKVQFLNPYGSTAGSVPKGDAQTHQNIRTRLGAKLRAYMGGAPAPAPKPAPRSQPAQSPPKALVPPPAKLPPPAAPPAAETSTMEQAWDAFCQEYDKHGPEKGSQDDCQKQWFAILSELFPGKQPEQLNGLEWHVMLTQGPGKILPF